MYSARITSSWLAVVLAFAATPALASHRDCTAQEKQAADQQLWLKAPLA